jgi:hypothetical protein
VDVRPTDEQPLDRVGVGLPGVRVRLALFVGRLAQELDLRPLGNLLEELAAPLLAVAEGSARRVLLASVALECRRRLDVVAGQRPEHRLAVFDDQQSVRRLARGDVERVGVELVGALVRRRCDRRRQVVEDVVDGLGIDDSGVDDEPVLGGRLVLVEDPSRPFQRLGGALARPVGVDVLGLGVSLLYALERGVADCSGGTASVTRWAPSAVAFDTSVVRSRTSSVEDIGWRVGSSASVSTAGAASRPAAHTVGLPVWSHG